jgi:hypothetical protein
MRRKPEQNEFERRLTYSPNRFEYFAGIAFQGLITGRSSKDFKKCVPQALELAREMEKAIDLEKDN